MRRIPLITIALSVWMWADAARYTRCDAGIVTDNKTGLQWQDDYSDNGGNIKQAAWRDAINYCENLTLGGYSDWRLPNFHELYYLADRSKANPAIDTTFQNVVSDLYWSSTTLVGDEDEAWHVDFAYGHGVWDDKSSDYFVRCVRAGQ